MALHASWANYTARVPAPEKPTSATACPCMYEAPS